jgi:hypothetical protein
LLDFLTGTTIAEATTSYKLKSVAETEALLRRILLRHGYSAEQNYIDCDARFAKLQNTLSSGGIVPFMTEIRRLNAFVVVAEELHYRRAAARLCMSQSPLSRMISNLELEIGAELFVRNRRNVRLTAAGAQFLLEARALIARFESAVINARQTNGVSVTTQTNVELRRKMAPRRSTVG